MDTFNDEYEYAASALFLYLFPGQTFPIAERGAFESQPAELQEQQREAARAEICAQLAAYPYITRGGRLACGYPLRRSPRWVDVVAVYDIVEEHLVALAATARGQAVWH